MIMPRMSWRPIRAAILPSLGLWLVLALLAALLVSCAERSAPAPSPHATGICATHPEICRIW